MALTNKLKAIADAIRAKTGSSEKLTLDGMASAIANISTGGSGEFFVQSFNQPTGKVLDFSGYTTDIKNVIAIFWQQSKSSSYYRCYYTPGLQGWVSADGHTMNSEKAEYFVGTYTAKGSMNSIISSDILNRGTEFIFQLDETNILVDGDAMTLTIPSGYSFSGKCFLIYKN